MLKKYGMVCFVKILVLDVKLGLSKYGFSSP